MSVLSSLSQSSYVLQFKDYWNAAALAGWSCLKEGPMTCVSILFATEMRGNNLFPPLDRRLAKRQMWNISTGRDPCIFHYFQTRRGGDLVRAKWLGWNLFRLSEEEKLIIFLVSEFWKTALQARILLRKVGYRLLSTYTSSWNINLGSSSNHECWRHDISVHPSWFHPVCSRATPCDSNIFSRVLSRIASSVSFRSVHRSTFANVHSDSSNPSAWISKDMWRNWEAFGRGWWDQLVEGHERTRYLGCECSFFSSPVSGAHFSSIDCGLFTAMVTRFSCTSAVLAIFDSGRSGSFPSVRH